MRRRARSVPKRTPTVQIILLCVLLLASLWMLFSGARLWTILAFSAVLMIAWIFMFLGGATQRFRIRPHRKAGTEQVERGTGDS
jgi:hypothetical protein